MVLEVQGPHVVVVLLIDNMTEGTYQDKANIYVFVSPYKPTSIQSHASCYVSIVNQVSRAHRLQASLDMSEGRMSANLCSPV